MLELMKFIIQAYHSLNLPLPESYYNLGKCSFALILISWNLPSAEVFTIKCSILCMTWYFLTLGQKLKPKVTDIK